MRFALTFSRTAGALVAALALTACDEGPAGPGSGVATSLRNATLTQTDRFGLPAVATVFIPTARKDAYNAAAPADDRTAFRSFVVAGLTAFGHPDPGALADALLPDIQPADLSQLTGFLAGGRRLQDDVITAELGLIFGANAALNDDNVDGNDRAFPTVFPYLAEPWLQ